MKKRLMLRVDAMKAHVAEMADAIFDRPEAGRKERFASELIAGELERNGFCVERGVAGMPTAFRAVYERGTGGASIGLLCEYDALEGFGHGCAHHIQGPACLAAALALKETESDVPIKIVVYGTPDEEGGNGKVAMLKGGCFADIDAALMAHGGPETTVDVKSLALKEYEVRFKGMPAHAAIRPEDGRSALDALLLCCHGVEFLREHVRDDVRMHYSIDNGGGPSNIVPQRATGTFVLRAYSAEYLAGTARRFMCIVEGAALMTDTAYEIEERADLANKIPVPSLNGAMLENARTAGAPGIAPPREHTGSTDFANLLHRLPGACIRVAFVPPGTSSHSQEYLRAGKSEAAHEAAAIAAKVLALTAYDLASEPALLARVKAEHAQNFAAFR